MRADDYLTNMTPPQIQNNETLGEDLHSASEDPELTDELDLDFIGTPSEDGGMHLKPFEFYENLVTKISFDRLDEISRDLLEDIEQDKLDRKEKDYRIAKTMKRLGYVEDDVIGGASFQGASRVSHPMLSEVSIDFSSRAIRELLPPGGCVRTKIVGKADSAKLDIAERKRKFVNYLLTEKMNYRTTLEKLLSQLPFGGSQYMKLWWDETYQEVRCDFVPIDQIYLPYYTQDFYRADRVTQVIKVTRLQWSQAVQCDKYSLDHLKECQMHVDSEELDDDRFEGSSEELSASEEMRREIDGAGRDSGSSYDEEYHDDLKMIYESHIFLKLEDDEMADGTYLPYIVTVDKESGAILSIYRNWDKTDVTKAAIQWYVEWRYIPWDGAYGIGLPEILDGMAAAATGSARGLMDSAFASTFPPTVMMDSAKVQGQNSNVQPGTITRISAGTSGQQPDIRTMFQTLNIAQPSPVLLQMMQYFDTKAQAFQSNLEGLMDGVQGDAPVGTTLALVEESSKRYAAIFARAHDSNHNVLKLICKLLGRHLDVYAEIKELDSLIVTKDMFKTHHDIIPVSDPNIFSEAQRYAQLQTAFSLAQQNPQLYNMVELNKRMLQLINLPDYEKVLAVPQQSGKLNAAAENIAILSGTPIQVFTDQDHLAHIQCHLELCNDPIMGVNNTLSASKLINLIPHIQEHLVFLYGQIFDTALKSTQNQMNVMTHEGTAEDDQKIAQLNQAVLQQVQEEVGPFMQQVQEIQQKLQQYQQQPPQDPNMLKAQVSQQEVERKTHKDQMDFEIEKRKIAENVLYDNTMLKMEEVKYAAQTGLEVHRDLREQRKTDHAEKLALRDMDMKEHKHLADHIAQQHSTAQGFADTMVKTHQAHKDSTIKSSKP